MYLGHVLCYLVYRHVFHIHFKLLDLHRVVTFIICGHYIRFNIVEVLKLVLEVHIKHKEVVDFTIQHV
jgi:hypothetical protein